MNFMKKFLLLIISALTAAGCSNYPELKTVDYVDINRYTGKWYEIAAFPQSFQKGCFCSTAEYFTTDDDYIKVVNSCRKDSPEGELKQAEGKAFIEPNTGNAKLTVQFFWPFRGKYWIIELDENYSYVVVGHPNREYLWILSRTPEMPNETYDMLIKRIYDKGFDTTRLQKSVQSCFK